MRAKKGPVLFQGIKGNIYKQASELALGKIKKSLASKK